MKQGNLARVAACGAQAPRIGTQASWGPCVPSPSCLKQRGSTHTTHAGLPLEWQAPGCLGPRPWLFGAVRSQQCGCL